MSTFINIGSINNNNSRNLTINGNPSNTAEIINSFFHDRQPEDIQAEEVTPGPTKQQQAYTAPFPKENDYNAVREYVEERKKHDEVFRQYCKSHTRTQLCERLTDEFGWVVDANHYGHNIRRNL